MIIKADARHIPLPDDSVQCCVTSPPYWGLRKYAGSQERVWGGSEDCRHEWLEEVVKGDCRIQPSDFNARWKGNDQKHQEIPKRTAQRGCCVLCGAWRGAFGLEPTIALYVQHSVEILREVRRVLRPDGVCFWNLGDSYSNATVGPRSGGTLNQWKNGGRINPSIIPDPGITRNSGLKPKDLCLIPARVAIAAQEDGWWVRSDIIWGKRNPMPESVRDRPTDAYEHILMLTKSARYYWNAEAVKEPCSGLTIHDVTGNGYAPPGQSPSEGNRKKMTAHARRSDGLRDGTGTKVDSAVRGTHRGWVDSYQPQTRNLRNLWEFPTAPYSGAHFATFPPEMVIRCLQAAAKPGDLVLDVCAGSGTVGEVAFNMGRRFVLCDLAYQDLQHERIPALYHAGMSYGKRK